MHPILSDFVGSVVGLVMLASALWLGYAVSAYGWDQRSPILRWTAALLVAYGAQVALFWLLLAWGLFSWPVALPLWLLVAAGAHFALSRRRDLAALLRYDRERLWDAWRQRPGGVWPWLAGAGLFLTLMRGARLAAAPVMDWDGLTYHLLKAGRWVQQGRFVPERAPDAAGYFEYYSPVGDALAAWAMLPVSTDTWVAPLSLLVWGAILITGYTAARSLGVQAEAAACAAALLAFTPAVLAYAGTSYVDNQSTLLLLITITFVAAVVRQPRGAHILAAAGAAGLLLGVKPIFGLTTLLLVPLLAWSLVRIKLSPTGKIGLAAAATILAALGTPAYLRAWLEKGSPLYPFPLIVLGQELLAGNEELLLVGSGATGAADETAGLGALIHALLLPRSHPVHPDYLEFGVHRLWLHLGLGPALLLIGPLAVVGFYRALGRPSPRRWVLLWILVAGAQNCAMLFGDTWVAARSLWIHVIGRVMALPWTALVLGAALAGGGRQRSARLIWLVALGTTMLLGIPYHWCRLDLAAAGTAGAILLVSGLVLLWVVRRSRSWWVRVAAVLCVVGVVGTTLTQVRSSLRTDYFRAVSEMRTWTLHPLADYARAWPIWRRVDSGPEGQRIAAAAGWDQVGHNWMRYPLLGHRLQNEVFYVPVTTDGRIIDYRLEAELARHADAEAWLARLVEARIDTLVLTAPPPPEAAWVEHHPEIFSELARSSDGLSRAYDLDQGALRALVAEQGK